MSTINSIFKEELFAGTVALVTGGGSGIGLRTARELVYLGCVVYIAARKEHRLSIAANAINEEMQQYVHLNPHIKRGTAKFVVLDIRSKESRENVIATIRNQDGKIDFLVNNAGGQFPMPAGSLTENGWKTVIDLNLNGTFLLSQEVFNQCFSNQRHGVIVNVIANMWNGFPVMSHTGAARMAIHNLTQTLAVEWANKGVRVLSIAPGTILSSGLDSYDASFRPVIEKAIERNYAYRFGTVEEIAAAIIFMLSPASNYTTGTTLKVDAGESIYSPLLPPTPDMAVLFPAHQDFPYPPNDEREKKVDRPTSKL